MFSVCMCVPTAFGSGIAGVFQKLKAKKGASVPSSERVLLVYIA